MKRIALTKARNAYALLDEICSIILREPLRYNQGQWVQLVERDADQYRPESAFPVCGTIGCVAGWAGVLVDGRMAARRLSNIFTGDVHAIHRRARNILGLTDEQATELFDGDAVQTFANDLNLDNEPLPGSKLYATMGAARIRQFMLDNEAQLKAHKFTRVTK